MNENYTEKLKEIAKNEKWGFLRETKECAEKAGRDRDTGLVRTGLNEYLKVIFPEIKESDWIHDEKIDGCIKNIRPDYRCDILKLIVEFDGIPHYTKPSRILKDKENEEIYNNMGYKVVRIPYFIQLTNDAIKQLFGRDIKEKMFNGVFPSIGVKGQNTPAYLCYEGLKRMAKDFKKFPDQYKTNLDFLKLQNDEFQTGANALEKMYNSIED